MNAFNARKLDDSLDSDDEILRSDIGTKEYWEELYQKEIDNYEDHKNPGEIWFGKGLVIKLVDWIKIKLPPPSPAAIESGDSSGQVKILDLGCGNGNVLYALHREGYTDLTGLDYAEKSIKFVNKMASDLGISKDLKTYVADVLTLPESNLIPDGIKFNLIIDKGTFDAILLNPDCDLDQVKIDYVATLKTILAINGFFIISSCNWTREELLATFVKKPDSYLTLIEEIDTPKFSYAGITGSVVTCLIFQRSS